ncbi:hypothetical protein GLOTRDRAFT_130114 [Gloeophyllum trabeum ATCC 11539]|uniref:Peptidase S33 tripeptidyl aminopeptidase-like C-terminal domain-containing protein n=1 Tax=Gloeophyllum trabeum (strain ATCC 11539 / FP-39264 / Madison 617) TaxID=670483 RepID=S7RK40_GLOTA|nr:uncharacterized protein GLOTRDRAFT_130114 [Gloeophyllum trabeum ATCC 11539]EPQ54760.1 hypothetical protein GLOTRDRAFT_130114 [Gloeophyllum trabeum ATCC 11539]
MYFPIPPPLTPLTDWGWSYGSAIGQYMTQILPPERINRMIIDGIVDVVGWSGYPIQPYNITDDMDHILQEFADSCASAGDACVLSNLTSSQILSLIDSTLDELYYSPPLATDLGPGYGSVEVDAGVLRFALFESMYLMLSWPTLAELLAETFAGNYTSLVQAIVPAISPTYVTMRDDSSYATSMIYCNDAKPYDASHPPPSIEQLTDNVVLALNQNSRRLGEFLYGLGLCQFWQDVMPSQSHYNGTFDIAPGTLQTPMLVFSQTFDPVTDLANALRSSERLGDNARLIQQVDGYGHCTISQTSFCALPIVQAYMLDGAVPDSNHTLCQVDQLPFKPFDEQDAVNGTEGLDLESRQAWVALGLSWAKLAAA